MDCKRVWLHSTRDSQHLTGVLAICDARRMGGIFTFIDFTLWTRSILLVYRILQSGRSYDESDAGAECDECGERNNNGEGKKEGEATAWMVAFGESMMCAGRCSKSPTFGKSIERTNNSSCRCWRHRLSSLRSPRTWDWIEGAIPAESDPWPPRLAGWATHS